MANTDNKIDKQKITFYISEKTIENLEEIWYLLRREKFAGLKEKVSRSSVVEAAIDDIIKDFEAAKEKKTSRLIKALRRKRK